MRQILQGVGAIVLALIFFAAGILNLVLGIGQLRRVNAGQYATAPATVTKVESYEVSDDDAPGGTRTEYHVTVEFTADGQKVVTVMKETPKEFYEGMKLDVWYNTQKPTEVILPGSKGHFVMIGLGIVGILAGVAILFKKLTGR